jgi:hypothetical protein
MVLYCCGLRGWRGPFPGETYCTLASPANGSVMNFLISGLLCLIKSAQCEQRIDTDLLPGQIVIQSTRLTGMGLSCPSRACVLRMLPTALFAERSILTSFRNAQG